MSLDGAKVVSSNNVQIVLNVTLGLHNNGQQDVTFDGALYSLSANANPLSTGYINQKMVLRAGSTAELNSTISINLSDNPSFSNIGTSFSWRMNGNADITTAGSSTKAPFDFNFKTA